jgi:hypothetical protein
LTVSTDQAKARLAEVDTARTGRISGPELLQLCPSTVVTHPYVVKDAVDGVLAVAEKLLGVTRAIDLVIGELPAGERWAVWRVRFQVRRLADPLPQAGCVGVPILVTIAAGVNSVLSKCSTWSR